jgi:radical SAM enzyme (TIGR01210 family)
MQIYKTFFIFAKNLIKLKSYYIIPIFIPEKACPQRCIYCNQYNITQNHNILTENDIINIIEQHLSTIPQNSKKRIAFFGGTFTGMSLQEQNFYLNLANRYIKKGLIDNIQLSTRPDYINQEILENLKKHNVKIIELGAQSLDDEVLKKCNRGHSAEKIIESSNLINSYGFDLGLQMMIGLPLDTIEKSVKTATQIVNLKAKYTRIYPTLVIKNTALETLYRKGLYKPLTLNEAVLWTKEVYKIFIENDVTILRVGLHPTEGFKNNEDLIAGPFHVAFKEIVLTKIWGEIISDKINLEIKKLKNSKTNSNNTNINIKGIIIETNINEQHYAIGHKSENKNNLKKHFRKVFFKTNPSLHNFCTNITFIS